MNRILDQRLDNFDVGVNMHVKQVLIDGGKTAAEADAIIVANAQAIHDQGMTDFTTTAKERSVDQIGAVWNECKALLTTWVQANLLP
jgi:parvulin-like peptidyl-prolyl isomerase